MINERAGKSLGAIFMLLCTTMCSIPTHGATEGEHDHCILLERTRTSCCSELSSSRWKICGIATSTIAGTVMGIGGRIGSMRYLEYPGWSLLAVGLVYTTYKAFGWYSGRVVGIRHRASSYDRPYYQHVDGIEEDNSDSSFTVNPAQVVTDDEL